MPPVPTSPPTGRAAARIFVDELPRFAGESVAVRGWLQSVSSSKGRVFLKVRDRTGTVRAVCAEGELAERAGSITAESALMIVGTVEATSSGKGDEEVSLAVEELEVIAPASSPLPLDKKSTINTRLDYRHLDLRDPQRFLICDVQATLDRAIHEFLLSRRFMSIRSPRITAGGSESGAAVFEVPYFGESACLVQSVQFYAQLAMAAGFDRVFEIGPVFRAENSVTSRHATEFTVLHIEMSWLDSPEELMTLEEELVKHALTVIGEVHGAEIERHFGLTIEGFSESIPRIPVAAAMEMLSEQAERLGEARPDSISERALSKYVHENYGHDFVFLTDFPASERPFYTMLEEGGEAEEEITRSFDMVWRGVEITSGSQREHKYERLLSQIRKSIGEDEDALGGYLEKYFLDMFRYGCPPHGGFGIGIDRFLMVLLALPSIRETSYVFRGPDRFVP